MLDLVQFIRSGDRSKLLDLYQANRGLLAQIARRYLCIDPGGCDLDDLMQAGFFGLVEAVDRWEPARGAWSNIATLCVKRAMRAAVGLSGTRKRAHLGAVSLDEPIPSSGDGDTTRADLLVDENLPPPDAALLDQEASTALNRAMQWVGWHNRGVMEMYLQGATLRETAERLGISTEKVSQLRSSARRRLQSDPRLREELGLPIKSKGRKDDGELISNP